MLWNYFYSVCGTYTPHSTLLPVVANFIDYRRQHCVAAAAQRRVQRSQPVTSILCLWKLNAASSSDVSSSLHQIDFNLWKKHLQEPGLNTWDTWNGARCQRWWFKPPYSLYCHPRHMQPSLCWSKEHVSPPPHLLMRVPSIKIKDNQYKVKIKMAYSKSLWWLEKWRMLKAVLDLQWVELSSLPASASSIHSIGFSISKPRVCPSNSSTTTDREIWLTTAIKYSAITLEKKAAVKQTFFL